MVRWTYLNELWGVSTKQPRRVSIWNSEHREVPDSNAKAYNFFSTLQTHLLYQHCICNRVQMMRLSPITSSLIYTCLCTLKSDSVELTQKGLIKKIMATTGLKIAIRIVFQPLKPLAKILKALQWLRLGTIHLLLVCSCIFRPMLVQTLHLLSLNQLVSLMILSSRMHPQLRRVSITLLNIYKRNHCPKAKIKVEPWMLCRCRLCRREPDNSINSAKSRSGYIIKLGGCPWSGNPNWSQLFDYQVPKVNTYSLSQAMRALLPLQCLYEEFMEEVEVPPNLGDVNHHVHATVHKDNTSTLTLATEQCITPCTHHYHARWHFFW